jgi:hypothetical protein
MYVIFVRHYPLFQADDAIHGHNYYFMHSFDSDQGKGVFLHSAIREIHDFSLHHIIAVQLDENIDWIRQVNVEGLELGSFPSDVSHKSPATFFTLLVNTCYFHIGRGNDQAKPTNEAV